MLVSRTALGSTDNHNCGDINNLCGLVANYPTAASCYDMYMVRFDGTTEAWATKLTDTTASLPAYGTGADRRRQRHLHLVASTRTTGASPSTAPTTPATSAPRSPSPARPASASSTLHDRRQHPPGRSHEGRERQRRAADAAASTGAAATAATSASPGIRPRKKFVAVCKNDAPTGSKSGRLAFAPNATTIDPVDLNYTSSAT